LGSGIRKKFIPDTWGKKAPDPDPDQQHTNTVFELRLNSAVRRGKIGKEEHKT
jgi:hypothetical protein